MTRRLGLAAVLMSAAGLVAGLGAGLSASAQTHVVKKAGSVVRAVAVYEFTGEEGKVTASRVVPVSVFIQGHLEDAGFYLARPIPFALGTGTVFSVDKAGVSDGTLELSYDRHMMTAGLGTYDDGWLGFGVFKAKPKVVELVGRASKGPLPKIEVGGGRGPKFATKPDADSKADDAAREKVDRSGAAGAGTTVSASKAETRPIDADPPSQSKSDPDSDTAKDNVDRPTLKKRSAADVRATAKVKDTASVSAVGDLNDDPDRPSLHRGKPASRLDEEAIPPLRGVPAGMTQMVAVSDATERPEHEFARAWESDAEKVEVTSKLREMARTALTQYGGGAMVQRAPVTAAKGRKARPGVAVAALATLTDESVRGFVLSYGGAATYSYTAGSAGAGGVVRYVTLVAQQEPMGQLKLALTSVTDAVHLDRTPWMRLVDAVDAEASNRASLLYELRGQTTRQFGLYRVLGAQAEQIFVTSLAQ